MSPLIWHKSSFSGEAANCVNIAAAPDGTVRLRESDEPEVIMSIPSERFGALLGEIKSGRLLGIAAKRRS